VPAPYPPKAGDPDRIGEFQVIGRLGEGGQGVVHLATAPDGRQVAIKLLHPWFGGTVRGRKLFAREIEAAGRVKSHTARVLASGEHRGRPYIVSEFIAGESVQDRVYRDGAYAGAALAELATGTASALAAIHAAGLVHCDFKPANILTGDDGPRVVDFGIARALATIAQPERDRRGTPPYMAPEQITGGRLGPHTDVFAWGSTMVYAATGKPPFGFSDDDYGHGVMYRITHDEPEVGGVPQPLRDVVAACLHRDPGERPTAAEVLARLGDPAPRIAVPAGTPVGAPLTGHTRPITCVAYGLLGERPVAVTGGHDHTARVWDLAAHRPYGPPLPHDAPVLTVACGRVGDRPVAVTGCQDHTLNVWDLATGERTGEPLRGHTGAVSSLALTTSGGRPVAVSVSADRSVRLWDLTGHRQAGPPLVHNTSVMAVACGPVGGRAVAVVGGVWDQSLRVLDLDARRTTGLPLTGHTNSVMTVAYGRLGDRPIALTGGYDRTVRVWDLAGRHETGAPLAHTCAVMSVAFGVRDGRPTALTSGADHAVRVWDLAARTPVGEPLGGGPSRHEPAVAVAFGELAGRPLAITCGEDLTVTLWRLAS
jgi:eukaryotic-like serine/threonine-protein kinase